jgi:putative methyltransferase
MRQQTVDNRLPGLPRYARVNTLLTTLGAVRRSLVETGHVLLDWTSEAAISGGGGGRSCRRDEHVPDLIVFKPKGQSDISRVPMVARGELIVQQKASCFPALALAPPPGSQVIDGCAAPGNKTTHLAALMGNEGSILAYEQDARRCALLEQARPPPAVFPLPGRTARTPLPSPAVPGCLYRARFFC